MADMIVCTKCSKHTEKHRERSRVCRECTAERHASWYKQNRDRLAVMDRERYHLKKCDPKAQETRRARNKRYYNNIRDKTIITYGGFRCSCECGCSVSEPMFLTLDHINNDGAEHRRILTKNSATRGAGLGLYHHLKRNGFPPGLRVLCSNCNHGRYRNGGTCPAVAPKAESCQCSTS